MKTKKVYPVLILSVILFSFLFSFKAPAQVLARPLKVDGVPVYIMCEPEQPYTVVDNFNVDGMVVLTCPTIEQEAEWFVKRSNKAKLIYDAILYSGGKKGLAIKFK